jgi:hypothetical protein
MDAYPLQGVCPGIEEGKIVDSLLPPVPYLVLLEAAQYRGADKLRKRILLNWYGLYVDYL